MIPRRSPTSATLVAGLALMTFACSGHRAIDEAPPAGGEVGGGREAPRPPEAEAEEDVTVEAGGAVSADEAAPGEGAAASCADEARAASAVARTLEHAERVGGVALAHLVGCAFDASRCDGEPPPSVEPEGARCVVDVSPSYGMWNVTVRPRVASGAPRWLEATVEAPATAAPVRMWISASTWALAARTPVVVGGVDGRVSHTHGGEAARVGDASFLVRNPTAAPLRISARRVEWLTSPTCEGPFEARATPTVAGLTVGDADSQTRVATVPPGESPVAVWFAVQPAYYAYCDRFAARVTFVLGGEPVVVTAETLVARREPLRH